eukprot:GHVT01025014.1.p1 GENE.GHVT01025014.1~~GHVT01025014.1.p1  ORF type:complete len:472 (-),score=140.58 GHVT01025014.1:896-2311(-)
MSNPRKATKAEKPPPAAAADVAVDESQLSDLQEQVQTLQVQVDAIKDSRRAVAQELTFLDHRTAVLRVSQEALAAQLATAASDGAAARADRSVVADAFRQREQHQKFVHRIKLQTHSKAAQAERLEARETDALTALAQEETLKKTLALIKEQAEDKGYEASKQFKEFEIRRTKFQAQLEKLQATLEENLKISLEAEAEELRVRVENDAAEVMQRKSEFLNRLTHAYGLAEEERRNFYQEVLSRQLDAIAQLKLSVDCSAGTQQQRHGQISQLRGQYKSLKAEGEEARGRLEFLRGAAANYRRESAIFSLRKKRHQQLQVQLKEEMGENRRTIQRQHIIQNEQAGWKNHFDATLSSQENQQELRQEPLRRYASALQLQVEAGSRRLEDVQEGALTAPTASEQAQVITAGLEPPRKGKSSWLPGRLGQQPKNWPGENSLGATRSFASSTAARGCEPIGTMWGTQWRLTHLPLV